MEENRHLDSAELLAEIWRSRACLVCGRYGPCGHREPSVDLAEFRAYPAPRKPVRPEQSIAAAKEKQA